MFGPNHCENGSSSPRLRKALSRLNLLDSRYRLAYCLPRPKPPADLNGMGVSGSRMAPAFTDGCRVNVTKTEPYARGVAVVLWFLSELITPGGLPGIIKRVEYCRRRCDLLIHMIVPGGGLALDGRRWVSSRPAFLLPVRVLGKLFRRLFLTRLLALHEAGLLQFFGEHRGLADRRAFQRHLAPVRKARWIVYAKPPFAGPEAVLAYLSRYTHQVAISKRRLLALDETGVTFRYKDYHREGADRQRTMTLSANEFIRRFLLHVLLKGFHRIRHYGLLASAGRQANVARARELLGVAPITPTPPPTEAEPATSPEPYRTCPCCGGRMIVLEVLAGVAQPRGPPAPLAFSWRIPAKSSAPWHDLIPQPHRRGRRDALLSSMSNASTPFRSSPSEPRFRPRALHAEPPRSGLPGRRAPFETIADRSNRFRAQPAGSCMGGFRTPALTKPINCSRTASENLHHISRQPSVTDVCFRARE